MSFFGLLLVVVVGCFAAPDLTKRDVPSLFSNTLTKKDNLLIQDQDTPASLLKNSLIPIKMIQDHLKRNVFPPFKPIFSPEEWEEIVKLFNLTRREVPSLFGDPLTTEDILQLIKDQVNTKSNLIGRFQKFQRKEKIVPSLKQARRFPDPVPNDPSIRSEVSLELLENELAHHEILALLGDYLKGK